MLKFLEEEDAKIPLPEIYILSVCGFGFCLCLFLSTQGELEGSVRYRDLMTSAENFFRQSVTSTHR